jgi:hypothetical protein
MWLLALESTVRSRGGDGLTADALSTDCGDEVHPSMSIYSSSSPCRHVPAVELVMMELEELAQALSFSHSAGLNITGLAQ